MSASRSENSGNPIPSWENFKEWFQPKPVLWSISAGASSGLLVNTVLSAIFPEHVFFDIARYTATALTSALTTHYTAKIIIEHFNTKEQNELRMQILELKFEKLSLPLTNPEIETKIEELDTLREEAKEDASSSFQYIRRLLRKASGKHVRLNDNEETEQAALNYGVRTTYQSTGELQRASDANDTTLEVHDIGQSDHVVASTSPASGGTPKLLVADNSVYGFIRLSRTSPKPLEDFKLDSNKDGEQQATPILRNSPVRSA
jgi:hypothetical protein